MPRTFANQLQSSQEYINLRRENWVHVYGEKEPVTAKSWNGNAEYLKKVVPKERLLFYSVKEGWEPLCKILGKEIPDVPFPKINDGEAIDRLSKQMVLEGLKRWAMGLGIVAFAAVAYLWYQYASMLPIRLL